MRQEEEYTPDWVEREADRVIDATPIAQRPVICLAKDARFQSHNVSAPIYSVLSYSIRVRVTLESVVEINEVKILVEYNIILPTAFCSQ